jgi:hypothetical protein
MAPADLVHAGMQGPKKEALSFPLRERYAAAVRLFSPSLLPSPKVHPDQRPVPIKEPAFPVRRRSDRYSAGRAAWTTLRHFAQQDDVPL